MFIAFAAHFYMKVNFSFETISHWTDAATVFFVINKSINHFQLLQFQLVGHKSEVYEYNIKELELLKDQLDETGDQMENNSHKGSINIV